MKFNSLILFATVSAITLAKLPGTQHIPPALPDSFTDNYDFEGIASLSNCSGSVFRMDHSQGTDFALILTNGHCVEGNEPQPGEFFYERPSTRRFTLLNKSAEGVATVSASHILYATETGTDIAIYRINETYDSLRTKYGVNPLALSPERPTENTEIELISGYWKKGYTCAINFFAHMLKEDIWTWKDSIRYSNSGCETIGGTSGSPVVVRGTRTIVGVNNTGNEDGEECTLNNPCEVDEKGNIYYKQGLNYGQQTYLIYSCINQNGTFDLSVSGCKLIH